MKLWIATSVLAEIIDHAARAAPIEACGIVLGGVSTIADPSEHNNDNLSTVVVMGLGLRRDDGVNVVSADHPESRIISAAIPAPNVAAEPATSFEIDPATLLRVHRTARAEGRGIVGWYHSHPDGNGRPSATDAARAVEDGRIWLIAAAGRVSAWRATSAGRLHARFEPAELVAV